MLPDFKVAHRVAFDQAMLVNDFEKWLTAFDWNGRKVSILVVL
jgi:hypothetical protein